MYFFDYLVFFINFAPINYKKSANKTNITKY